VRFRGSVISLFSIFADNVNGDYLDGVNTLEEATGLETLSLRMRWFLDFNRLKKRS